MRRFIRIFVFLSALGIIIFGFVSAKKDLSVKTPSDGLTKTSPTWKEEELLLKINEYREKNKLTKLSLNDSLNQAAKIKLATLIEYPDDEKSVIKREDAVKAVGYSYGWIGDLALLGFFKTNDPIEYWLGIENAKATLLEKNFKEVGIAIKQTDEQVSASLIFTSPKTQTNNRVSQPKVQAAWGGLELWEAINKRRVENGVNPLKKLDPLCTIAAVRLSEIIDKGSLDGHLGFEPTLNRSDLRWISEKYNISEFLVSGYKTPAESVNAWENTMGHKKLLTGGEYVWGCVYAQDTFGVAITAY